MDSISSEGLMRIGFANLRLEGGRIGSWSDAILRVNAELQVEVAGSIVYEEPDLPVVELAYQLHRWIVCDIVNGADFEYHSMESADNPLIWIHQKDGAWIWGSRFQQSDIEIDRGDIETAVRGFIRDLDSSARDIIGLQLLAVLLDPAGTA